MPEGLNKSQLTLIYKLKQRALSRAVAHRAVHKDERSVWSTGDSNRSIVDNTWTRTSFIIHRRRQELSTTD